MRDKKCVLPLLLLLHVSAAAAGAAVVLSLRMYDFMQGLTASDAPTIMGLSIGRLKSP